MPCYESRPDTEKAEMKIRLDLATRVACTAMKVLLSGADLEAVQSVDWGEALRWYAEHRKLDAERGEQ